MTQKKASTSTSSCVFIFSHDLYTFLHRVFWRLSSFFQEKKQTKNFFVSFSAVFAGNEKKRNNKFHEKNLKNIKKSNSKPSHLAFICHTQKLCIHMKVKFFTYLLSRRDFFYFIGSPPFLWVRNRAEGSWKFSFLSTLEPIIFDDGS